jgi:hypothetical protein
MEAGNENGGAGELDAIHHEALANANGGSSAVESAPVAGGGQAGGENSPRLFAEATLTTLAKIVSESVSGHFLSELSQVTTRERAERIAAKGAMSEFQQKAFVQSGLDVADKYGWTRFISPEIALLGVLAGYGSQVMSARRDIAVLLREVQAQAKQP